MPHAVPFAAAASLALAACTSEPAAPARGRNASAPVSSAAPPPAPEPSPAAGELFGQWQLVSLTGADLAGHHEIYLLVGSHSIEAASQCVPFDFRLPGAAPEPAPVPRARPPEPEPVCARGLSRVEQVFPQVMTAARRAERRLGGRVAFVGPRGEAVVERPAAPVVNPFHNEPGLGPSAMWGEWRVAALDGRPLAAGEPIRLLFGRRTIEMQSGCVAMGWRYGQDRARLTVERRPLPVAVCERALRPQEAALQALFDGEVRIARSTAAERLLVGREGSVLVRR